MTLFGNQLVEVHIGLDNMALKDWKKYKNIGHPGFVNPKNQNKVMISRKLPNGKYRVRFFSNYQIQPILEDYFKTKSQALKYAKAYMRKN